jgi:hypothetical protein
MRIPSCNYNIFGGNAGGPLLIPIAHKTDLVVEGSIIYDGYIIEISNSSKSLASTDPSKATTSDRQWVRID